MEQGEIEQVKRKDIWRKDPKQGTEERQEAVPGGFECGGEGGGRSG